MMFRVFCGCLLLVAYCCIVLTCCDFGLRVVWLLGGISCCLFCWVVVCCLASLVGLCDCELLVVGFVWLVSGCF